MSELRLQNIPLRRAALQLHMQGAQPPGWGPSCGAGVEITAPHFEFYSRTQGPPQRHYRRSGSFGSALISPTEDLACASMPVERRRKAACLHSSLLIAGGAREFAPPSASDPKGVRVGVRLGTDPNGLRNRTWAWRSVRFGAQRRRGCELRGTVYQAGQRLRGPPATWSSGRDRGFRRVP